MLPPKPGLDASSRSVKSFEDLHSSIYVGVAGSRAFGHGDTLRKAHISELAWYEDDVTVLNGVEDAVPLNGELTIESTPNGEGNNFYNKWVRAREGKSPYKPFFFPWWWDDDYRIPRSSEIVIPTDRGELTYTEEELDLVTKHNLREDQIRWRRWKIGEKDVMFWQEYPEDEVSCWLIVGDPVFDIHLLNELASGCYDGTKHEQGWNYWIPPEDNVRYVVGVDTSSGAPEGSYSAACVLNERWEVCATFQARLEPHQFATILKALGNWYNNAELVIERNFTGYAVLEQLSDYPNIAHQRDFTTGKVMTQKGWWSNTQTRDLLMTITKENIGQLKLWDANLVRQLRSYRYIKLKTKYREEAQTFDDLAFSLMLAVTSRKIVGTARGYRGSTPGWNW
uniref:Putative terminase n=1 Tax=viral metagenome TaxID=1070528 RepID=A0A6M3IE20_9ZZZZ